MYFAKNIVYSEVTDGYMASVVFDSYDEGTLLEKGVSLKCSVPTIQENIVALVKSSEQSPDVIVSYDEAKGLLEAISQESELFFE